MRKIAFVPLDDRPCNFLFPQQLSPLAGADLLLPPKSLLGRYLEHGDPRALAGWLHDSLEKADSAILSADMLVFGGLVASRSLSMSPDEAFSNLEEFENILRLRKPGAVYASSVIMRESPTITSPEDAYKSCRLMERPRKRGKRSKASLPAGFVSSYSSARERNNRVNRQMISFLEIGLVDFLLMGTDDLSKDSPARKERLDLEDLIGQKALKNMARIYCGADEMGIVLLARMALEAQSTRPAFFFIFSHPGQENLVIPRYEDRNISALLNEHLAAIGAHKAETLQSADILVFVHLYPGKQREAAHFRHQKEGKISSFVREIAKEIKKGRMVAVADLAYANGTDPELCEHLIREVPIPLLGAYAAWNTAGNTLGTVLSHAALRWLSLRQAMTEQELTAVEAAHQNFLFQRFVDDWLYQTNLRPKIKKIAMKRGWSPFCLGENIPEAQRLLEGELLPLARDLFPRHFVGVWNTGPGRRIRIEEPLSIRVFFPWERLFEIEIESSFRLEVSAA